MNRYTLIERLEHKQSRANERWIMDQHFIACRNTAKAAREARIKKIVSWGSIFGIIVRVVIAFFK
ncbi:hypothetical protein [Chitinophaga sp.]|uniref:hypothetical protein n=1 Tax=Chitinophaga sp. TaxID=1869181 RepID=UPI002F93F64D